MSWLISKSLMDAYENSRCSQEQAVESSAGTCSDGKQSPQLNVMLTQQPFLRNDKPMDFSGHSLFGLTLRRLTENRGAELLTLYLAGFHARTCQSPVQALDSTDRVADCGEKWPASLARYDPDSHSLKTAQGSLFSDLIESSVTLPRSGSMRNGECFLQPTLERPMKGNGSGLLPTPTASSMPCEGTVRLMRKQWLEGNYTLAEASAIAGRDVRKSQGKVPEWFPTPCASDNRDRGNASTPAIARRIAKGKQVMLSMVVSTENGRLNPMWEEWLMAWPIGWTQLSPLGMDRWQEWLHQHSPFYAKERAGNGK